MAIALSASRRLRRLTAEMKPPKECHRLICRSFSFDSEGNEYCDDDCYSHEKCPAGIPDEIRWKEASG